MGSWEEILERVSGIAKMPSRGYTIAPAIGSAVCQRILLKKYSTSKEDVLGARRLGKGSTGIFSSVLLFFFMFCCQLCGCIPKLCIIRAEANASAAWPADPMIPRSVLQPAIAEASF